MTYWIHPTRSFTGGEWGDFNTRPVSGGQKVYFRRMNLKETGSTREDGIATLTFND